MRHKNRPNRETLHRLYVDEFKSIPKIAELCGCGTTSVHRWLKDAHIKIRSHGEARLNGRRRLTDAELYQMYIVDRMGTVEISKKCGGGSTTIRRWLEDANIKLRTVSDAHLHGKQKPSEDDLYKMYIIDGATTTEIGAMCGVGGRTVWRWLTLYGIKTRSCKEANMFGKQKPTRYELDQMYTIDTMSTYHIGKKVGVNAATVGKWLNEYGIYVRSVSEALIVGDYRGENSPLWRGGISKYCHLWNEEVREYIREKYGRVCFLCGMTEEENGQKLSVHHVDMNKSQGCDGHGWKLVPLCRRCHGKTNGNRYYWYSLIMCKLYLESSAQFLNVVYCI